MKKNTITNITFSILGAFLLGLGIDIGSWTIKLLGSMLIIIVWFLVIEKLFKD